MVIFCGRRDLRTRECEVFRNGKLFSPAASRIVWQHTPDGFNWGYQGTGPAQLALALLLSVLRSRKAAQMWHQEFKRQFVARWSDLWVITDEEICHWWRTACLTSQQKGESEVSNGED